MAFSPEYQRAMADIQSQIAEVELRRAYQGNLPSAPTPPLAPGRNASRQDLQAFTAAQDKYEADLTEYNDKVRDAERNDEELGILRGQLGVTKAQAGQQSAYARASNAVGQAKQGVSRRLGSANKWAAHIPTPGGVWLPFLILMALFMILFPNNGHTRLKWLFLVIIGQAALPGTNGLPDRSVGNWKDIGNQNSGSGFTSNAPTYNQNTNPNQSPSQIVTSLPTPPSNPTSGLIPLTVALGNNGSSGYLDSLFSIGF